MDQQSFLFHSIFFLHKILCRDTEYPCGQWGVQHMDEKINK